jgi:hypothetical protein
MGEGKKYEKKKSGNLRSFAHLDVKEKKSEKSKNRLMQNRVTT